MNYLRWLKTQGKSLVLQGPQGCGTGLMARQLAGDSYSHVDVAELISGCWIDEKTKTVIVEGIPTLESVMTVKELIIVSHRTFIFCTNNSEPLDFGQYDRRFHVIKLGDGDPELITIIKDLLLYVGRINGSDPEHKSVKEAIKAIGDHNG